MRQVQRLAHQSGRVASICIGGFLLASAGLLEGRRATTHWAYVKRFAQRFPGVRVDSEPIFMRDGKVWTSAGASAGIDLALALVEADIGREAPWTSRDGSFCSCGGPAHSASSPLSCLPRWRRAIPCAACIVTARGGDADATLALLRRSRHDPAVFLAACPALHRKLSTEHNREPWVDALAAIWRNRVCTPSKTRLYREIALACVHVAHWGLARRALSFGIGRHGASAEDLTLLAWCEANTGALDQARSLIGRAMAKDSAHAGAKDLLRRLQRPLLGAAAASPWRQCVWHPKRPLLLEPLHVHHARALHHQYRDSQIAMMTGLPSLPTVARAQQWIETRLEHGGYADFAVMGRDAGFVGHVGLRVARPAAGFFFWIGADHQGKGYGTAAGRLLCSRALSLGLEWVFASAYRDNLRSIGALERIGFQRLAGARSVEQQDRVFLAYPRRAPSQAIGPLLAYQEREQLLFEQSEHAPPLIDA